MRTKQSSGFSIFTYNSYELDHHEDSLSHCVAYFYTKLEKNIRMVNAHFKPSNFIKSICSQNLLSENVASSFDGFLKNANRAALRNVCTLKINILKNVGNSGCAMKNLSIIGQPGSNATAHQVSTIQFAWKKHTENLDISSKNEEIITTQEVLDSNVDIQGKHFESKILNLFITDCFFLLTLDNL